MQLRHLARIDVIGRSHGHEKASESVPKASRTLYDGEWPRACLDLVESSIQQATLKDITKDDQHFSRRLYPLHQRMHSIPDRGHLLM